MGKEIYYSDKYENYGDEEAATELKEEGEKSNKNSDRNVLVSKKPPYTKSDKDSYEMPEDSSKDR